MQSHDLLFELLTEEFPPKQLLLLAHVFLESVRRQLVTLKLHFTHIQTLVTPRRLAIVIQQLAVQQPPQKIEYKGPPVHQGRDAAGNFTVAGQGFLKKYRLKPEKVTTWVTDKGEFLYYSEEVPGLSVDALLPNILKNALKELPITKPMRWAHHDFTFIRPVHGVILLYGARVIPAEFFGLTTQRSTYGHRQATPSRITIDLPQHYALRLQESGVMVDHVVRKKKIMSQMATLLDQLGQNLNTANVKIAIIDPQDYENLLDEVTALVEWPRALLCRFEEHFLQLPPEALMASMQHHQKCFGVTDAMGTLLPYFIAVSNLYNDEVSAVIQGNERVMRARLADAHFFYTTDLKLPLEAYMPRLAATIYQEKLGTLQDKIKRWIPFLQQFSAPHMVEAVCRAAQLCKLDLFSQMVGEFPELQGTMGKYYALQAGESIAIAAAIEEHYWPRYAEDTLPTAPISILLALADRLDTILGFFQIGIIPTGSKDPFALRRAAASILKIILKNQLTFDLRDVFFLFYPDITAAVAEFFQERFKTLALEQGITPDVFQAACGVIPYKIYYTFQLMQALQGFKAHPALPRLVQANKRIQHILAKNVPTQTLCSGGIGPERSEQRLWKHMVAIEQAITPLLEKFDYAPVFLQLAELAPSIDDFFEHILVMTDDLMLRASRLNLLYRLHRLFSQVARFEEMHGVME